MAGVGGVETVNVGQNQQQVGVHQVGNQRRQAIVIAEDSADFVHGHHVVFVEKRHHTQLQQTLEGVANIKVGLAIGQVANGEQRLGHGDAVDGELLLIYLHQSALPHGGGHLPGAYVPGNRTYSPQGGAPDSNGPGGHQHHLCPLFTELAYLAHDAAHNAQVDARAVLAAAGEDGGAGLHDNALVQQRLMGVAGCPNS